MDVRHFDREVDADWRRTSYSGLIRAEAPSPGSPRSARSRSSTTSPNLSTTPSSRRPPDVDAALASPMADLPAGADFGSLVHAVLEHADPRRPTCSPSCAPTSVDQLRWWPVASIPTPSPKHSSPSTTHPSAR